MSELTWLFVAFMVVWIAIGAYLLSITARQKKLDQRLRDLEG